MIIMYTAICVSNWSPILPNYLVIRSMPIITDETNSWIQEKMEDEFTFQVVSLKDVFWSPKKKKLRTDLQVI